MKKPRRKRPWDAKSKSHPIITEIHLGKSIDEVVEEYFVEEEWSNGPPECLDDVVRTIVEWNDPGVRFGVEFGREH